MQRREFQEESDQMCLMLQVVGQIRESSIDLECEGHWGP